MAEQIALLRISLKNVLRSAKEVTDQIERPAAINKVKIINVKIPAIIFHP
jgi:hypothetical protein